MKFLTDRKEIAKAINIDKLPVITFDMRKCMEGYENCYEGSKVAIEGAYSGKYAHLDIECTPHIWSDTLDGDAIIAPWTCKKISLNNYGCYIHSGFGLRDVENMIEWNKAPRITAGAPVIVFFKTDIYGKEFGFIRKMKVSEHVTKHCTTVAYLEDEEE